MLIDLENIVGVAGYFIDDQTYEILSFKQKKPRKIKLSLNSRGYLMFSVYNDGKHKNILYHQIIVKVFIDPNYNSKTQDIDHLDHNKLNNLVDNLKVVSRRENQMNKTVYRGVQAIYLDDIGENIPVNAEHGVYYSKTFDKFYRLITHTNKYRQLTEGKSYASMWITYRYNNKTYTINTTKFREELSK